MSTTPTNTPPRDDLEPLVPLDVQDLPEFDPYVLPDWAGRFASALAAHTETSPNLAVATVLGVCSAAVTPRMEVMIRPGYTEPCNLWIVAALPSGNRKSAVLSAATRPLADWEREEGARLAPRITEATSRRQSMEARVREIRKRAAKAADHDTASSLAAEAARLEASMPSVPVKPQRLTSDATPERLGSIMAEQGETIAWISSEGGLFETLGGRYSGGVPNLDLMLKAHSGDPERVDRGSRPPVSLRYPRITTLLCPQPAVLEELSRTPTLRTRGLLGRFLYLLPRSLLGYRDLVPRPVPVEVEEAYHHGVRSMLDWPVGADDSGTGMPYTVRLSDEAHQTWQDYAKSIEYQMRPGQGLEHMSDWGGKASGAAARIAGVLHGIACADGRPWEDDISVQTMQRAVEIMYVIQRHSEAAFHLAGMNPTLAAAWYVWDWVERKQHSEFRVRDAFRDMRHRFSRVKAVARQSR